MRLKFWKKVTPVAESAESQPDLSSHPWLTEWEDEGGATLAPSGGEAFNGDIEPTRVKHEWIDGKRREIPNGESQ